MYIVNNKAKSPAIARLLHNMLLGIIYPVLQQPELYRMEMILKALS